MACVLLTVACGIQGPVQPPRVQRPAKVTDLSALQVDQTFEVHFAPPQVATDGQGLTKPLEIELLYSVVAAGAAPSQVPAFASWVHLTDQQWSPYTHNQELLYPARITDRQYREWQGKVVVLAVRTLTRGFRQRPLESALSNLVYLPLIDVSNPVQNVTCQTTEKAIDVTWTAPVRTLTGQPVHNLSGYRIYRSSSGKPGTFEMVGEVASPPFADRNFDFGRTYFYEVRAVFAEAGKTAESGDSSVAEITPRDIFPPGSPTGLTGIYADGAVELIWNANLERDLAGYNVYRREGNQPFQKLTKQLLRTPILRDTTVEPNRTYSYYVTAVDLSGNESQASKTVEVETR